MRRSSKACGNFNARRNVGNHLPQAGVFTTYRFNVGHPQQFEGNHQVIGFEQCRHKKLQKLKPVAHRLYVLYLCCCCDGSRKSAKMGQIVAIVGVHQPPSYPALATR